MAEDRMAVLETLRKAIADGRRRLPARGRPRARPGGDGGRGRPSSPARAKGERAPERRLTNRNGYRERRWDTRVGTIDLADPQGPRRLLLPVPPRAPPAGRAGPPRGRPGGLRRRGVAPAGSRTSSRPSGSPRSARARSAGSAPPSTPRSRPSALGRLGEALSRTSGSTPPTSRSARPAGSCRWPPSSRSAWRSPASAGSSGSSSRRATTRAPPGPRFIRAPRRARPRRRPPRHQRRPPRPREGRPRAAPRRRLAALPGPLHPQRPGPRAPLGPEHGRLARSASIFEQPDERVGPGAARGGSIDGLRPRFPAVADAARRGRARPARPLHVPRDPPPPDPEHEPARAAQQGDQAPDRGRRHLPEPGQPSSASSGMILAEQDDEWQDGRRYFRPETMALSTPSRKTRRPPPACCWKLKLSGARMTRAVSHDVLEIYHQVLQERSQCRRSSLCNKEHLQRVGHVPARHSALCFASRCPRPELSRSSAKFCSIRRCAAAPLSLAHDRGASVFANGGP